SSSVGSTHAGYRSGLILQAFRGDGMMLKRLPLASISGLPLSQLLKMIGLAKSNSPSYCILTDMGVGEGLRTLRNGGVYVNGVQRREVETVVDENLLLDGKVMVIRQGRSNFRIVEVLNDEE